MGRKAAARRHHAMPAKNGQPDRIGKPGRVDQSGRTGKPSGPGKPGRTGRPQGPAVDPPRADETPGGRLPPRQEPKQKRPVRTIRVPGLFG
ncbi:hypothetical protein [Streptomyces noursei]|uniref:Uncharacterized protein n=1 Tax=Streptomyces noursei TaxID=1971 RepID=A0A2N8P8C7_STRNR|nr:hypothetical protein [Streptomyces noursei]PNE37265.1 hypothetical protein AOB60_23130 [Streptomyces noursei]